MKRNLLFIPNFRPKRSTPPKRRDSQTKSNVTKIADTPKTSQNNFPIISAVISASSIVGVDPSVRRRQNCTTGCLLDENETDGKIIIFSC